MARSNGRKGRKDFRKWPRMDRKHFVVASSFEEADQMDREYWWSLTPIERMRALELARQVAFNYGPGKPLPRFQRVFEVVELR
jgi:hypothetical protein